MKLRIYMDVEGQEALATCKEVWPWHYTIRTGGDEGPKTSLLLTEVEVQPPSREVCIPRVLEMLKTRESEINAEAHKDLRAIAERRENLLALTFTETAK